MGTILQIQMQAPKYRTKPVSHVAERLQINFQPSDSDREKYVENDHYITVMVPVAEN